jgi:hypothetical protein
MNDTVDLSAYNLIIATPMADGRPEDAYNASLDNTKQLIRQYGGTVANFKTKYIADIYLARAKLFSFFLRHKEATHLLMIDSDQDWKPEDVIWMLLLNRDFLAAVSCKKLYPLEFAFNMVAEDGKLAPLYHELETNVASVPFVGAAFMMISRACAEKMAASYPELEYKNPDGDMEYAVFDPIILEAGRRRLSEDYSFCSRWRAIGGKVEVKMDVNLGHTGAHRFSGSLLDYFTKTQPSFGGENGQKEAV